VACISQSSIPKRIHFETSREELPHDNVNLLTGRDVGMKHKMQEYERPIIPFNKRTKECLLRKSYKIRTARGQSEHIGVLHKN